MIPHHMVQCGGQPTDSGLRPLGVSDGCPDALPGQALEAVLVVVSQGIPELHHFLEERGIGTVRRVPAGQENAELRDSESRRVLPDGLQVGVAAVDHSVPGCCRDKQGLVGGAGTGPTDQPDGHQVKKVPHEPLKLGDDSDHEGFVELLGTCLRRSPGA